jgi:hypothetical protein
MTLAASTTTASAALLADSGFDSGAIVNDDPFLRQNDLGDWRGPGTGWQVLDLLGDQVADRNDNGTDTLAQVITGAGITGEYILSFDLFSIDEVTSNNAGDDNNLSATVYGVTGNEFGNFRMELFGGSETFAAGTGIPLLNATQNDIVVGGISNVASVSESVSLTFDVGPTPYDFIVVALSGRLDNTNPPPASSVLQLDNVELNVVPEPGTLALAGVGAGLALIRRRASS